MGLTLKPKNCMLSMKTKNSIFNIIQLAREGDKLSWVRYILFVHAFSGCDTTSHIFRIGKTKLTEDGYKDKLEEAKIFYDSEASKEAIADVGESIAVSLYRKNFKGNLNKLRFQQYSEMIAKNSSVTGSIRSLCASSKTFAFHAYRVFHQIQVWLGNDVNPKVWGWQVLNGMMVPIQ